MDLTREQFFADSLGAEAPPASSHIPILGNPSFRSVVRRASRELATHAGSPAPRAVAARLLARRGAARQHVDAASHGTGAGRPR
jgi:hypothetical protein